MIKNFLQYFHKTISDLIDQKVYELQANRVSSESIEQKIYEIQDVYENRYGKERPSQAWKNGNVLPNVRKGEYDPINVQIIQSSQWTECVCISILSG